MLLFNSVNQCYVLNVTVITIYLAVNHTSSRTILHSRFLQQIAIAAPKSVFYPPSPHQPHRKYAIPTICIKIISGMPYLNFRCSVLCLNAIIPHNAPRLPPIIANPSRVRSGTLHQCFMAQYLSHPYNRNVPILIIKKYLMNSFSILYLVLFLLQSFLDIFSNKKSPTAFYFVLLKYDTIQHPNMNSANKAIVPNNGSLKFLLKNEFSFSFHSSIKLRV